MKSAAIYLWYDAFVNNDTDSKELFSIVESLLLFWDLLKRLNQN